MARSLCHPDPDRSRGKGPFFLGQCWYFSNEILPPTRVGVRMTVLRQSPGPIEGIFSPLASPLNYRLRYFLNPLEALAEPGGKLAVAVHPGLPLSKSGRRIQAAIHHESQGAGVASGIYVGGTGG